MAPGQIHRFGGGYAQSKCSVPAPISIVSDAAKISIVCHNTLLKSIILRTPFILFCSIQNMISLTDNLTYIIIRQKVFDRLYLDTGSGG